jgi:hypothetical protein
VVVGVIWLLLLPLDEYSRSTYISENALLPGQVHTYFGGTEQNIFDAYRHEVDFLAEKSQDEYGNGLLFCPISPINRSIQDIYQIEGDPQIIGTEGC